MSNSSKIKQACETYWTRERAKYAPKRRNEKPEEAVVTANIEYFGKNDWFMNRYESKTVKHATGGWRQTSLIVGHPDLGGVTPIGIAGFVECKALGKRNTLRPGQREFLVNAINRGAFAIVSDSVEYTVRAYNSFRTLDTDARVALLMSLLPHNVKESVVTPCPF